jgi:uracil-DNA glycosylase
MPYWRRALSLLDLASVPTSEVFFTNAYVGLIAGDNPSADFPGRKDPSFGRWCAAFLEEQIQVMRPRLVVALGGEAQRDLHRWNVASRAGVSGKILKLPHPSNRKGNAAMLDAAASLRNAYEAAGGKAQITQPGALRPTSVRTLDHPQKRSQHHAA